MVATPGTDARVRELHERAVRHLIAAHKEREDEPLVLAIQRASDDPSDISLLEVLAGFPGGDEDELFETEFPPSADLLILGKLHLTLCSPAQLRSAIEDGRAEAFRSGAVVYQDGSEAAQELIGLLGL